MIKQVFLIVLLSLAVIFFRAQAVQGLHALVHAHNYLDKSLQTIFSEGHVGRLIQEMISLLILPLLGGAILAVLFWMVKRTAMPHVMAVVWAVWLVLLVTMVEPNSAAPAAAVATQQVTPEKTVPVSEQSATKD